MKSNTCWELCNKYLPGGVNSPVRSGFCIGIRPPMMVKGKGAFIKDLDGNQYIDCCMSWGALLHGHAHPVIVAAASEAIHNGSSFGTTTPIEGIFAQKICKILPSIEMIRFVSTGTESTMSAVRLARAYTGRPLCIKYNGHYHGHADQFLINAGSGVASLQKASSKGIPNSFIEQTISIPFNDIQALETVFHNHGDAISSVIVEPVPANMGVTLPEKTYLERLRTITQQNGTLLIFDEVISGFRVGYRGAQGLFSITPDITCLGKIIGGGFPAAAFGGKRKIMELLSPLGDVYQAGTLSGNPVAMHAGLATIELAEKPGFYEEMTLKMNRLLSQVTLPKQGAHICSCGSMWTIFFDKEGDYAKLFTHMLSSGVYIPPAPNEAWFVSSAHSEDDINHIAESLSIFFEKRISSQCE